MVLPDSPANMLVWNFVSVLGLARMSHLHEFFQRKFSMYWDYESPTSILSRLRIFSGKHFPGDRIEKNIFFNDRNEISDA